MMNKQLLLKKNLNIQRQKNLFALILDQDHVVNLRCILNILRR